MIKITQSGSYARTERFLSSAAKLQVMPILHKYGQAGVAALVSVTPKDSGQTAQSWGYYVSATRKGYQINWTNSNATTSGIPVVILLQYGHGTRNGAWVPGNNFVNPAIQPILAHIAEDLWKEVTKL